MNLDLDKYIRLFRIAVYVIIFFVTQSCSTNFGKNLEGWWTIDTLYFNDIDIKQCLLTNSIDFKEEGDLNLPQVDNGCGTSIFTENKRIAQWTISKSELKNDSIPFRLNIISTNEVFNGTHNIVFYGDRDEKLLKIEIWSEHLYLVCRKGLYNYDINKKIIQNLEKESFIKK